MNIIFRTDGNLMLGKGHVMRCLSLAKALRDLKYECIFVVSDESCFSDIRENGFAAYNLDVRWDDYDESLDKFSHIIYSLNSCMVIIDSYYYSDDFLAVLAKLTKVTVITETHPDKFSAKIDCFINYNIFLNRLDNIQGSSKTKYILGSNNALLRDEFEALPQYSENSRNNLVVLTGGSDPYNIAPEICKAIISDKRFSYINVNIISGKLNPNIPYLLEMEKGMPRVSVILSPTNMRKEIEKNQVAISAGGSTLYELCACAVPAISFSFADNQLEIVKGFNEFSAIPYAGDIREVRSETIKNILEYLNVLLEEMLQNKNRELKMRGICDGKGAKRVAAILSEICSQ